MKGSAPSARSFPTLREDVAHRPARGRRSHQPNLGLRPRPLPGGHCSLSTGPPLLAHPEIAEILIPQGTKLTLRPAGIAGSPVYHWTPYQVVVAGGDGEAKAQGPSKWRGTTWTAKEPLDSTISSLRRRKSQKCLGMFGRWYAYSSQYGPEELVSLVLSNGTRDGKGLNE